MDMPVGTFKNKLNEKLPQYQFTEAEEIDLRVTLLNIASDIQEFASLSFNDAIKKIARRKV